jgi:hypothetical protein
MEKDLLAGVCFVTKTEEGKNHWQGKILGKVENGVYLVQLFEWLLGTPSNLALLHISSFIGDRAKLYESLEDLREGLAHE